MVASPAWASHDALLPRSDGRMGPGAALALLAHAGLIGALALGLNWRLPQPTVVASVELWSAVPQAAAPAPLPAAALPPPAPVVVLPPPVPARPTTPSPPGPAARAAVQAAEREAEQAADRDAAIVVEQAKQRRLVRQAEAARKTQEAAEQAREAQAAAKAVAKLEAKAQAKADAAQAKLDAKARDDKRKLDLTNQAALRERREKEAKEAKAAETKAQDAQLALQREANLKRMLGQAGATGAAGAANASTGTAARDAAPSQAYAGRIRAYIKPNIVLTAEVSGNPVTEVEVKLAPDGSVISRRISKPSSSPAWDSTVLRAIDRTATLPRDADGRVPPVMLLVFPRQE